MVRLMQTYLDFEKSLSEIEGKARELRALSHQNQDLDLEKQVSDLDAKATMLLKNIYQGLNPWQKCQVARHPERPHCRDYIRVLFNEYTELLGDRLFKDDRAIMGGVARFRDHPVVVIGQEKGFDTQTRLKHNFGMVHPEGYRKAVRLMNLADKFSLPLITFIDTPGAYPGKDAEERGQAEAIAQSIATCLQCRAPFIAVIIGEGGSGGALALAVADRVVMLEHSIYSLISPEGCASILWKDPNRVIESASALRLTAQDLLDLDMIDRVVREPVGGAQRDPNQAIEATGDAIYTLLVDLQSQPVDDLMHARQEKYLAIGTRI